MSQSPTMVPEMEKPRVTEIRVRMDCNGCVQKIKKALHGITGIYDLYVDFPQQKITIIGWADPAKIVKAIKKTRKTAVICSHTEQADQPAEQTSETDNPPLPEGGAPPPESSNTPTEQPQTGVAPPQPQPQSQPEPDNHPPPPQPQQEPGNPPPPEAKPSLESTNDTPRPKDHEEIHVIYHHPPDYGYRYGYGHYVQQGHDGQWNAYPGGPRFQAAPTQPPQPPQSTQTPQPPQPVYVTHSYNTYKPSPYVTEYAYPHSPPRYSYYSRPDHYSPVYNSGYSGYSNSTSNGNGNITSMFSEENPNACTIA